MVQKTNSKKASSKKSKRRVTSKSNRNAEQKWYQKTAWIILLLTLFFPVGFFLMMRSKWNKVVKAILGIFFGFWFMIVIFAMSLPSPEQISLSADTSQVYDIDTAVAISLKITPEDCKIPESSFQVSGGELNFNNNKITFTSSTEGKFEIYAKYSGITSNKITLEFEDSQKKLAEEAQRIAAEQDEAEQIAAEQAEAERIAAEQAEADRIAQEQAEAERIAAEQAEANRIAQEQAAAEAATSQPQNPGNNFNTYNNPEQQQTTSSYVLNTNTMKFHRPSCRDVSKIAPQNYSTYDGSRDGVVGQGYSPCGHCNP